MPAAFSCHMGSCAVISYKILVWFQILFVVVQLWAAFQTIHRWNYWGILVLAANVCTALEGIFFPEVLWNVQLPRKYQGLITHYLKEVISVHEKINDKIPSCNISVGNSLCVPQWNSACCKGLVKCKYNRKY